MLEGGIKQRIERLRLNLLEKSRDFMPRIDRPRPIPLEEIDDLREVGGTGGKCAVIEKSIEDYIQADALRPAAQKLLGSDRNQADQPGNSRPAGTPSLIFLDLETTGFSSTPVFLAGTVFERDGEMRSLQYLARDYSEERVLLGLLDQLMSRFDICVTFNGKSFDMPYIRDRAKYHGVSLGASLEQYDLLHVARRRWKDRLPDCRLVTLETHILGRRRIGDVPGWEVPCIYHDFVHTKDARRLRGVLRHNLIDCISIVQLFVSLSEAAKC
ncbi:ribonuclease H-like domain-containing protein [Candidatus Eisenbacteria bacterium]|uniref:Ribonuclease H-like domain-containing protein n=1 Tax=Eiseniibacteriota bacterium TaxID=2212470 RepID=A0ABV6YPG6_UNCEI